MNKIGKIIFIWIVCMSCKSNAPVEENGRRVHLVTLDPGHFHAALVQKTMYEGVDSIVHVYAPEGKDLQWHLGRIDSYNARQETPTHWREEVYTGKDFFEKMLEEKSGNVVVLSGNNQLKPDYILKSVEGGFNVLADKPMVLDSDGFEKLRQAFVMAEKNNLLLYDIMTERYEITTILQRELSMMPDVFGILEKGTFENPAITKESVHHFYKYVSGSVLTRPAWFLDVSQQGEGIVDVMTHLVDLVQWESFPEQAIDFARDIQVKDASRWTTAITLSQFKTITKLEAFPDYLKGNVIQDTLLNVSCNGEIHYQLKDVHATTSVIWNYQAPQGAGDSHNSIMRGSKANLVIRQTEREQFKSTLSIEPVAKDPNYESELNRTFARVQEMYPGTELKKNIFGWEVVIPDKYKEGHEAHFVRVMQNFLDYFNGSPMPVWEGPNMLARYYTTTEALKLSKAKKN